MARLARLSAADHVHLVMQRGINAQPIVVDDLDRRQFLSMLGDAARAHRLAIHAYALVDNEFLMLAMPADPLGLGRAMQSLGRRYVAHFNRRHSRSGTLWDGRFRSTVIEAALHLRDAMCYVESAPLRANLVRSAQDHPWSSARHHLGFAIDPLITDASLYWTSGNTPFEREDAHRARLEEGLTSEAAAAIEASVRKGWALGSTRFAEELESQTSRRTLPGRAGRPKSVPRTDIY